MEFPVRFPRRKRWYYVPNQRLIDTIQRRVPPALPRRGSGILKVGDIVTQDLEYWARIPESERALQVWTLSEQLYRLAGTFPDDLRLRRSVERLHRR